MRKLNGRNKLFIVIFSIMIIGMIALLVFSIKMAQNNGSVVYAVSNNSVLFDSDTNRIDTSKGGSIRQRWDDSYYYLDSKDISYELGKIPIVYDKAKDTIEIFGQNYLVKEDGSILEGEGHTKITDYYESQFYKIADREYLIISPEIYTEDKAIYANKYLIVYIDKKGNASMLNDSINVNTINPLKLLFDKYTFDIANEKIVLNEKVIDLKQINGSTNEYKPKEKKPNEQVELDYQDLANQYNDLVNSFKNYIEETMDYTDAANTIFANTDFNITNSIQNGTTNSGDTTENLTNITKMVSLRGAIADSTYIDVTYSVSDVADQFQTVYLLVNGKIGDEVTVKTIILDKYGSTYRIPNLSPRHEYTISLGYSERVKNILKDEIEVQNQVEDVINVRTVKPNLQIKVDKISKGNIYFTFKMDERYALSAGEIVLYADGKNYVDKQEINVSKALSETGYSSVLSLSEEYMNAEFLELRLINAIYKDETIDITVVKKFTY